MGSEVGGEPTDGGLLWCRGQRLVKCSAVRGGLCGQEEQQ